MGSKFTELVVDSVAPDRLAAFWMAVLGWQPTGRYQGAVETALSQSWLLEAKSENRLSENQPLTSLNFPVFGDLRQSQK